MTQGVSTVKHVVAIASGKGGVGKSTVSVNLAVAAAQLGLKVGLLDADIYGPSQARLLGISRRCYARCHRGEDFSSDSSTRRCCDVHGIFNAGKNSNGLAWPNGKWRAAAND